jgi:hypothetical protein
MSSISLVEWRRDAVDFGVKVVGEGCTVVVELNLLGVDLEIRGQFVYVRGFEVLQELTKVELPRYDLMSSSPISRMVLSSSVLKMSMSLETPSWP